MKLESGSPAKFHGYVVNKLRRRFGNTVYIDPQDGFKLKRLTGQDIGYFFTYGAHPNLPEEFQRKLESYRSRKKAVLQIRLSSVYFPGDTAADQSDAACKVYVKRAKTAIEFHNAVDEFLQVHTLEVYYPIVEILCEGDIMKKSLFVVFEERNENVFHSANDLASSKFHPEYDRAVFVFNCKTETGQVFFTNAHHTHKLTCATYPALRKYAKVIRSTTT